MTEFIETPKFLLFYHSSNYHRFISLLYRARLFWVIRCLRALVPYCLDTQGPARDDLGWKYTTVDSLSKVLPSLVIAIDDLSTSYLPKTVRSYSLRP